MKMNFSWTMFWLGCLSLAPVPAVRSATESRAMAAVSRDHETAAVYDLSTLLDAGDSAVVTLVAGDTRLVAHRAVLEAGSPVFAEMFRRATPEATSSEVAIGDVEGPVLRQVVTYLYTARAPQLPSLASQILVAADRYGVWGLKAECERQVAAQLKVQNAAATAVFAVNHSCPTLTEAAVNFIKPYLTWVMSTDGWAHAVHTQPEELVEVSRLLGEPPAEIRSLSAPDKASRLIQAATEGKAEEVQALLEAGADVGATDVYGNTALHFAADYGRVDAARCLIDGGADVNARTTRQDTPLHYAAYNGYAAVVRLLAQSFADLSARDESGMTPLHEAATQNQVEAAAALLEAGADKGVMDNDGQLPLDLASYHSLTQLLTEN